MRTGRRVRMLPTPHPVLSQSQKIDRLGMAVRARRRRARTARLAAAALHLAGQRVVLGRWRLARRWRLASFRGGALSSRTVVELRLARRRRVVSSGQAERRRWANHRQTRQSAAGRAERRRRVSYVVQT